MRNRYALSASDSDDEAAAQSKKDEEDDKRKQQELEQQEGEQQGEAPLNVMQVSQAASERVLQWCCKCCVNYGFSKDKCVVERLRKVVLLSLSWRLA